MAAAPDREERIEELRAGRVRYEPLYRLAVGGVGEVWRGRALFRDQSSWPVAFKRLLPQLAAHAHQRRMFEDEGRLGMMLDHDNVVRVFDARDRDGLILIMEYVEGPSLKHVLDRLCAQDSRMSVRAALYIVRELSRALVYAHEAKDPRGRSLALIHGDVSPHNALIGVRGEVKLMDFGLARASSNRARRDPKRIIGKHAYVAPELILRRDLSQRSDLFSLGVVLWECLTGARLFLGADPHDTLDRVRRCEVVPPSRINSAVGTEIDRLLELMLAREPAGRHGTARAVLAHLEACMDGMDEEGARRDAALLARVHPSVLAADERTFLPLPEEPPPEAPFMEERADSSLRSRRISGVSFRPAALLGSRADALTSVRHQDLPMSSELQGTRR